MIIMKYVDGVLSKEQRIKGCDKEIKYKTLLK